LVNLPGLGREPVLKKLGAGRGGAVLSFFADDVELRSTGPFPEAGPTRGISHLSAFVDEIWPAPPSI
jgi:hypothetical protein